MVRRFKTTVDTVLAASAAYAAFGAAAAYPSAAPPAAALAFALGYGALLFLLPFSVYALVFLLAPRFLCQTRNSMVVCAVATPVALLAALLAVLAVATTPGAGGDVVTLAAGAVWAVDLAAVAALAWCLTNGGYTPIGWRRRDQYANFMDALRRSPDQLGRPMIILGDPKAAKRDAARFFFTVSAACAVAGGAAVGVLSSVAGGNLSTVATATAVFFLFALPVCHLYVPEYAVAPYPAMEGVLQRNPMAAWYLLLAPTALVLCRLAAAVVKVAGTASWGDGAFVAVAAGAGAMWAVDAATAVCLGRRIAWEIETRPIYSRSSSSEIAAALLMVYLRYGLYLHVFHIIGCGGQLRWFN